MEVLSELCAKLQIQLRQVAYVGDDSVDAAPMRHVGLAIAVQDAHDSILEIAHWQTRKPGGYGAAREVCDLILAARQSHIPGNIIV